MDIAIYGVTVTAIIVGLMEVAKKLGLDTKYVPLTSVILGVLAGCVYGSGDIKSNILVGLAIGLSSCGLYSGTKATLEGGNANGDTTKITND